MSDAGVSFKGLTCNESQLEPGTYRLVLEVDIRADSSIEAAGWMLALLDAET